MTGSDIEHSIIALLDIIALMQFTAISFWTYNSNGGRVAKIYYGAGIAAIGFLWRFAIDVLFLWDVAPAFIVERGVRVIPGLFLIALGAVVLRRGITGKTRQH